MTVRDLLVRLLDRNGTRGLLTWITNRHANRLNAGPRLDVRYDAQARSWRRRALGEVVYDGPVYGYFGNHLTVVNGETPWSAAARKNWFVHYTPKAGDVILDIGAEIGSDVSAFANGVGSTGKVISVEAHPATYRLLEATVRESGYTHVHCMAVAIADKRGEIFIEDASSMLSSAISSKRAGHRVPALSLDDLCREHGIEEIALLKMNIEGSERDAFKGMHETLKRTRHLCIACHDFRADRGDGEFFRTRLEVLRALGAAGFVVAPAPSNVPDYMRDHVHAWRAVSPAVDANQAMPPRRDQDPSRLAHEELASLDA